MLLANFFADLFEATIGNFLIKLLLLFDSFVYSFVDWLYQIILILCNVNILENSQAVTDLIKRVYVILGVVMLFLIAYSLLKAMVNPNEAAKGKTSPVAIIKNVLISVVLIALIPTIFDFAFGLQSALLTQNTIGKIILGTTSSDLANGDSSTVISNGGRTLAAGVLLAFLHPDYTNCDPDGSCSGLVIEVEDEDIPFDDFWTDYVEGGSLTNITTLSENVVSGDITYYFIISTIAGFYVLYVLLIYCKDIAVRAVKLSVFELIAPVTIFARMVPGEQGKKVFDNWIKATLSTFIEVFIRLALLFFAILIVKIVLQNFPEMFNAISNGGASIVLRLIAQAFIIIGVVAFIKDAPNLIKEITGLDGGKYGKSLMKGIGMLGASLGGGATAAIRSFVSDKDKPMSQRLRRAATANLGAGLRGVRAGSKIDKFGDIRNAAGKASAGALAARANREAAGGFIPFWKQQAKDKFELAKDWAGGSSEALKTEKDVNDKLMAQINEIKKVAEDYIDKHEKEFFVGLSQAEMDEYYSYNEDLKKANAMSANTAAEKAAKNAAIATAERNIENFSSLHAANRLDNIKAMIDTNKSRATALIQQTEADYANGHIDSTERERRINEANDLISSANNRYNSSRKTIVDRFATESSKLNGSVKEGTQIRQNLNTLEEIIKESKAATSVSYALNGDPNPDHADRGLVGRPDFDGKIDSDDAASFVKDLKKAVEFSNYDMQAKLDEQKRREERRKANSGGNDK